ncbi:uncharacterized protein LOC143058305 isoform X2 [Mytilus galloprovincialis]|uniref:uncharacterized protein LOC143058305 isoform X2 n=1 Tax=Mytilus galloprovincialis TaxID=29158 RepID=UPI003F7C46D4
MMEPYFVIVAMSIILNDIRIDSLSVTLKSDDLIIYGTSVELQCLSDNTSSQSSWYWFSENNLLFIDGHGEQYINKEKYIEHKVNAVTRQLTILHFEETDLKMYKCKHDLKSASIDLSLQRYGIAFSDMNNSSKLNIRLERQGYDDHIVVSFINTSSIPTCYYYSMNIAMNITKCNTSENGFLLNGMCKIVINKTKTCESQKSNVKVSCYLGDKITKTFEISACTILDVADENNIALITVCSVLCIIFGMIILIFIINCRKKILKGRDEDPCQPCQEDSSCSSTCSNDVTSKMLENDPNKSHI